MARRYFGTDGVRGVVGDDLTEDLVRRLGTAFARWSGGPVLVGRDTRGSGPALERALAAGLAAGGSDVALGGVLPTPAVALLAEAGGAVVSASHNPAEYNGVKLFLGGRKLADGEEEAIEALLDEPAPEGDAGGTVSDAPGLGERYVELVCERFGVPLAGLRVVLDCANGAMTDAAPAAFRRLGAEVVVVGDRPDGTNINDGCGATDTALLARTVPAAGADLGLAFDGDGDRVLAVDAAGSLVDGDGILAILALHLGVDLVAVTSMTNLGLHRLLEAHGIRVVTTDVGDRYVLEALLAEGGLLGGEQSGHVLYLQGHVTGDGLATGLLLCGACVERGLPLAELAGVLERFPQAKENVRVRTKAIPQRVLDAAAELNAELDGRGRVLVRSSGTEPVVRVLAEAASAEEAKRLCGRIVGLVEEELG
ncbi:MAG TPA: phosphoglucosamine mutase [Gaiellaceae bacterium]|nr:phosphoglucosamine mutase [Gaiellaceae bacterium]